MLKAKKPYALLILFVAVWVWAGGDEGEAGDADEFAPQPDGPAEAEDRRPPADDARHGGQEGRGAQQLLAHPVSEAARHQAQVSAGGGDQPGPPGQGAARHVRGRRVASGLCQEEDRPEADVVHDRKGAQGGNESFWDVLGRTQLTL